MKLRVIFNVVLGLWSGEILSGIALQAPKYGAHRAPVKSNKSEGKRNQLVKAYIDVLQNEAFNDRHVVLEESSMGGEVLGLGIIEAGRVYSNQPYAFGGEEVN